MVTVCAHCACMCMCCVCVCAILFLMEVQSVCVYEQLCTYSTSISWCLYINLLSVLFVCVENSSILHQTSQQRLILLIL